MELNFFLLLYITGVMSSVLFQLQTVPHNYYLIKTNATWPVAQNYSRENYKDLATVESADDWVKLKQEATGKGVTSYVWLGLYDDIQSWRWTFNDLPLKTTAFTMWNSGQPDNRKGREWCGVMYISGYWHDYRCTYSFPFICYNAKYSGADRYIVITTSLVWTAARAYCQQYHTDLASATNSAENDQIRQVSSRQGASWIGLYRENWKWSDGTNASNLLWSPGAPDNVNGSEDCGILYNGLLADEKCSNQYYFFCHTVPIQEQQTVRLQLKADGSVLDPAVQSAILEQIKQKLAERNMLQNITVSWKKNLNGSIFSKKTNDDL